MKKEPEVGRHASGRNSGVLHSCIYYPATSFFPAKPLGCYGDGGAVFTKEDELAVVIRSLLVQGKGSSNYDTVRIRSYARMDTNQAAILFEKLKVFPEKTARKHALADWFSTEIQNANAGLYHVTPPEVGADSRSI